MLLFEVTYGDVELMIYIIKMLAPYLTYLLHYYYTDMCKYLNALFYA